MFATRATEAGSPGMAPANRAADLETGMVFAGGPNEVTDRILSLHEQLGHTRQILQMDVAGMPHDVYLKGHRAPRHRRAPSTPQGTGVATAAERTDL